MNYLNTVFVICSSAFLFLIVVGFFLGFARNWLRALIRFGIVLFDFIISLLMAPLLSNSVMKFFISGTTMTIFSFTIDFSELAENIVENNIDADMTIVSNEVQELAKSLINIAANLLIFVAMFFVILVLSLVIYWIVLIIVKSVSKKDKKQKQLEKLPIYTRFIGGFEGALTTVIIFFAFMIPLFGAMNVCNRFLVDNEQYETENVASAVSSQNLIAGQLYYVDDAKIGKFENYIEKYSEVKGQYDKSVIGKIFNFTRLGKLGSNCFEYLSNVKYKGEKVKFTDELVVVVESYNVYKELFMDNKFDYTNNESLDEITKLSDIIVRSKVVKNLVENILPQAAENWSQGEKFLGIAPPTSEEFSNLINDALDVIKSFKSMSRINENVKTVIETAKILNNHNILESVKNNTVLDVLKDDETVVKESILKLTEKEELKNNLPILLDDLMEIIYKKTISQTGYTKISKEDIFEIEDWDLEAEQIQKIVQNVVNLIDELKSTQNVEEQGEESEETSADEFAMFDKIGKTLDASKQSKILSNSIKSFIVGYINSEKFMPDSLSHETKQALVNYINEKWNSEENFEFEKIFNIISEMSDFAKQFANNEEVTISSLKNTFVEIIENEYLKQDVIDFIETNILNEIIKDDDSKVVALDLFKEFIYRATLESLDADLESGQAIIDLTISESELTEDSAETMLQTIASSSIIMDYIDSHTSILESTSLQRIVNQNLTADERIALSYVVANSSDLTSNQKIIFEKLFLL